MGEEDDTSISSGSKLKSRSKTKQELQPSDLKTFNSKEFDHSVSFSHVSVVSTCSKASGTSSGSSKKIPYTPYQKWVLFVISMVSFCSYLLMSVLAPFYPKEASLKGMSETLSGLVFSIYALVIMIASPFMGKLISQCGPKLLLVLGVFVSGSSNILFGLLDYVEDSTSFIVLSFLVRACEGFGAAAFTTASYTYILYTFPNDVSGSFGLTETFIGIGETIGPAVGGALYALGGYGLPFYILGSIVLLTVPLCMFTLKDIDPDAVIEEDDDDEGAVSGPSSSLNPPQPPPGYWQLIKIPEVAVVVIIVIVIANSQAFLEPTIEPHFRQVLSITPEMVAILFLILAVSYAIMSPIVGWLCGRIQQKFLVMVIGLLISSLGLLLLGPAYFIPLEPTLWLGIVAMIVMGASHAVAFIPTFEGLLDAALDRGFTNSVRTHSLISGLWSASFSLGEVTGPFLGGLLVDNIDFRSAALIMSVASIIAAIVATIVYTRNRIKRKKGEKSPLIKVPGSVEPSIQSYSA